MYRDDFQRAAQAAAQVLRRKQNRYLDSLDAGSLDTAQAIEPRVHSWSRLSGWRLTEDPQKDAQLPVQASAHWLRTAALNGSDAVFICKKAEENSLCCTAAHSRPLFLRFCPAAGWSLRPVFLRQHTR